MKFVAVKELVENIAKDATIQRIRASLHVMSLRDITCTHIALRKML